MNQTHDVSDWQAEVAPSTSHFHELLAGPHKGSFFTWAFVCRSDSSQDVIHPMQDASYQRISSEELGYWSMRTHDKPVQEQPAKGVEMKCFSDHDPDGDFGGPPPTPPKKPWDDDWKD